PWRVAERIVSRPKEDIARSALSREHAGRGRTRGGNQGEKEERPKEERGQKPEQKKAEKETRRLPPPRPRPTPRQSLSRFLMIFLGILAIYLLISPQDVGRGFGLVAGAILEPVIGFGGQYPVITILLAGLLTTTVSSVLRHFFTPWTRMAKM